MQGDSGRAPQRLTPAKDDPKMIVLLLALMRLGEDAYGVTWLSQDTKDA